MRRKLRAAVAGVGYLGQYHAEKYAAHQDVELVAVADVDAARASEIAQKHGCRALADAGELVGKVDLASVAVPTELHRAVAQPLLEAGIHLLVEKPVTSTLDEADALIAAAKQQGVFLAVGHLERFNPAYRALAQAFERPLYIECERLSGFKQRGLDVDVVADLMIHDLDLALALAGSEIAQLSAAGFQVMTDAIDIANVRIEFANGCVASLSASRVSQQSVRKLRVFQADRYGSADLQAGRLKLARRGPGGGVALEETGFEDRDALRAEVDDFVGSVRDGRAPLVGGSDGRRALALALEVTRLVQARLARFAAVSR